MWDARYADEEFVYGTRPNDFLAGHIAELRSGRALCLGEGEGRNAVFLAEQGFDVTAVDASSVGLGKAHRLAGERGVGIRTVHADLADFEIVPGYWDLILSIFCHVPAALRADLHRRVVAGLAPGGAFLLEAYTPRQIAMKTGGPPDPALMMELATLRRELDGLQLTLAQEIIRPVHEGRLHFGDGAVVQVIALRPGPAP